MDFPLVSLRRADLLAGLAGVSVFPITVFGVYITAYGEISVAISRTLRSSGGRTLGGSNRKF